MADLSLARAAFIVGSPRSGTTLLRVMLDGHPKLFSPPEMVLAPFDTMAERAEHMGVRFWEKGGLRRALMALQDLDVEEAKAAAAALAEKTIPEVYAHLQALMGDRMLVDKCPHLSAMRSRIEKMEEWFPEPIYIWIVRHPGSVIRSLQNMPMAEVMLQGYDGGAEDIWRTGNKMLGEFFASVPPERVVRIRYEDLVSDPKTVMEKVCATLGVAFDEAVIRPYEGDRMREGPKGARAIGDPNMSGRGKIQPELARKWLDGFDPRSVGADTRELALRLGYDLDALPLPPIAKVGQGMALLWETARRLEEEMKVPMDLDAVEGRRFLLRMVRASIDLFVEQSDVHRPTFQHAESASRKMFADCPDADYHRAPIRVAQGQVYRLWGRIPEGTLYVGLVLYGKKGRVSHTLADTEMTVGEDGSFEVLIGTEEQSGNWLRCDGDENALIVRQYFTDRAKEPGVQVQMELVGDLPAPAGLDARELAAQLGRAERMLRSVFERTIMAYKMASTAALNNFIEIPGEQLFPTPDNRYQVCWYRFGFNQVMFVRGRLPQARYFGFTLYNAWMESLDYRRHTVSLNHTQIETAPDGSFELCLAHRDPGHPNWLDTSGHHAGYLLARSLLPDGESPKMEIQVMYEKEWEQLRQGT